MKTIFALVIFLISGQILGPFGAFGGGFRHGFGWGGHGYGRFGYGGLGCGGFGCGGVGYGLSYGGLGCGGFGCGGLGYGGVNVANANSNAIAINA